MSKPDWFPFHVLRFKGSAAVLRMTHEAGFAYVLLLAEAWHQEPAGSLPDDDGALAAWARLTPSRWKRVRPEIMRAFEKRDDGRLYQPYMADKIAPKSYALLEQRREAGRASANARSTSVQRPPQRTDQRDGNARATNRVVVVVGSDSSPENTETTATTTHAPLNERSTSVERRLDMSDADEPTLTADQVDLYRLIVRVPAWCKVPWLSEVTARDLVMLPTTTLGLVQHALEDARKAHKTGANNPAGIFIKALRRPDPGVVAMLKRGAA